ncbi:MAG: COG3014 family protein, partial [Methylobacter sp.]
MPAFTRPTSLALPFLLTITLSGCSTMRSYDNELKQTIDLVGQGRLDQALTQHEANNTGGDFDLLYYLEKGELLRLKNQYSDSANAWLLADQKVNEWENEAKIRAGAILENAGAVVLNDKTRRYDGHDYEKVMLSTQLALDHLLKGDWNAARTEIKKTHEREALIAEINAKNTEEVEKESKEKGITTTFKDLNGYPVQTLNAPEVTALKNGYQSAFSHYLAGFVYEALNEPGLASPGYRQAIELQPNVKILEQGLATLDARPALRKPNETDVLLVVETGAAPALTSVTIPVPVIVSNLGVIPISFPVLHSDPSHTLQPSSITVDGKDSLPLTTITSIDAMSKRALRDDMP